MAPQHTRLARMHTSMLGTTMAYCALSSHRLARVFIRCDVRAGLGIDQPSPVPAMMLLVLFAALAAASPIPAPQGPTTITASTTSSATPTFTGLPVGEAPIMRAGIIFGVVGGFVALTVLASGAYYNYHVSLAAPSSRQR